MKKLFLMSLLVFGLLTYNSNLHTMSMKEEHDLFSHSSTLKLQRNATAQEQASLNFKDQIQEVIPDKFYIAKIEGKDLYAVMERVTDENIEDWQHYAQVQSGPRSIGVACNFMKNFTGDGSCHFAKVLNETSHHHNEIWVGYLINSKPLYSIENKYSNPDYATVYRDKFTHYSADDLYVSLDQIKQDQTMHSYAKHIKMFISVTSSPHALITSHMGVSKTIESILQKDSYKDLSMDLHSFTAKFMLMRNPEKKLMVNAPVTAMEVIMEKNLPQNTVFIGTKEMAQNIISGQTEDLFNIKGSEENLHYFDEGAAELCTEWQDQLIKDGSAKTLQRFKKNTYAQERLSFINNEFIIDDSKIKKQKDKQKEYYKNAPIRNAGFLPLFSFLKMSQEEFYSFLERHQPIISVDGVTKLDKQMILYDPKNPHAALVTITKGDPDYNWLFTPPFAPAGEAHYIAIDLHALADCRPLDTISKRPLSLDFE